MTDLSFPGYRSFAAGPDNPFRVKWNAVWAALDVPDSFELPALTLPAIGAFNESINDKIVYTPEPGGVDDWQEPARTLALGCGDCEEYAILKYATLLKSGLAEECLRLVVGEIKSTMKTNPAHAWCAAYLDGTWRALDNKFERIIEASAYLNWIPKG